MLQEKLASYKVILASGSPRRQELLKAMGVDFSIELKPVLEEFPPHLKHVEIANYLAKLKASSFKSSLNPNEILITSDTLVWHNNHMLGKPISKTEAINMLIALSNSTHEVITSVCLTTTNNQLVKHCITHVTFKQLSLDEISYYVNTFNPIDKAGAYGIQEWIGQIGVTQIKGSYFNVVGFPTHLVYEMLCTI